MSILRPYQRQALDTLFNRLDEGPDTRLAIEMATGLGKTVTGAQAAVEWLDATPVPLRAPRVLILVHTEEITAQWEAKLKFAGGQRYSVGVVKADRNEVAADIVVGSVQTLMNHGRRDQIRGVGFIIVDECHHAVAPSYRYTLQWFNALSADNDKTPESQLLRIPVLGLTATLSRSDGQALGHVWQDLAFSRSISWAQRKGYLLDVASWTIKVPDITAASSDVALDAMLANGIAPEVVVKTWMDKACNLSTVLFAPLVKSAQAFADAFNEAGVKAE
ncbi:MAG TPA: DEAD/DEAH box helicase family protein, partial [Chloroflexia bacterium]|nr:DEAD/DEAH box helicase family protein [Chloroflexia bacterium]